MKHVQEPRATNILAGMTHDSSYVFEGRCKNRKIMRLKGYEPYMEPESKERVLLLFVLVRVDFELR